MDYTVPQIYIERYADLLVNYALGGGAGIATGDLVRVTAPESAKPLYSALCRAVWQAGGNVLADYRPDDDAAAENLTRDFLALASPKQVSYFAELDDRPVRHRGDGAGGETVTGGVLGADRRRVLSRRR